MRSAAARERVESGALVVQHISGEFQVADIGRKPLGSSRIVALLKLANVTGAAWSQALKPEASPEVCTLRGLCSWSRGFSSRALRNLVGITEAGMTVEPAMLFVLTLLAAVKPVMGQPVDPTMMFSWFEWTVGLLLILGGVALRWGWLMLKGVQFSGTGPTVTPPAEVAPAAPGNEVTEMDELDARERYTGLTLLQRARLRRQLLRGEVVEAPILRMRFGGLPTWLQGSEREPQDSRMQTGGSSSSHKVQEIPGVRVPESASSQRSPVRPEVQIGGSSGSGDPVPVVRVVEQDALPDLAADQGSPEIHEEDPSSPSLEITAGDSDSGSGDSFSRFVHVVGGRRLVWRVRDEMSPVFRNLLTVCGEVLVSFLGDGSRELVK